MTLSKIELSQLLEVYGKLLTDKQRDIVAMFCDCDCGLSEIAAEQGISRQGVRDCLIKSEAALVKFEESLHLAQLTRQINLAIQSGSDAEVAEVAKKFVEKE